MWTHAVRFYPIFLSKDRTGTAVNGFSLRVGLCHFRVRKPRPGCEISQCFDVLPSVPLFLKVLKLDHRANEKW